MITDADVKKLKAVFLTKDDAKVFATKDDLKVLAKQADLLAVKAEVSAVKDTVEQLSEYVIPALGNIFKWTDDIHAAITGKKSSRTSSGN